MIIMKLKNKQNYLNYSLKKINLKIYYFKNIFFVFNIFYKIFKINFYKRIKISTL